MDGDRQVTQGVYEGRAVEPSRVSVLRRRVCCRQNYVCGSIAEVVADRREA